MIMATKKKHLNFFLFKKNHLIFLHHSSHILYDIFLKNKRNLRCYLFIVNFINTYRNVIANPNYKLVLQNINFFFNDKNLHNKKHQIFFFYLFFQKVVDTSIIILLLRSTCSIFFFLFILQLHLFIFTRLLFEDEIKQIYNEQKKKNYLVEFFN